MAGFEGPRYSPAVFDSRGEFVRDLPLDLITAWHAGDHSPEEARRLLEPFRVTGTVVASDSAGLTRMSLHRDPLEVMALINRPKEIVWEHGTAIGGQGLGVWAADNTEMFYPEEIGCDEIASMLLSVQDRICDECEVHIGLGADFDSFFLVGNSVYGREAGAIECLTEDRTEGGEIVLTRTAWDRARSAAGRGFRAMPRCITDGVVDGYRLLDGVRGNGPGGPCESRYPLPFSIGFQDCLRDYYDHRSAVRLRDEVWAKFGQNCTVLLVEREGVEVEIPELGILLEMERSAVAGALGALLLGSTPGTEVKTAGSLSIYLFPDSREAMKFAVRLRGRLAQEGIGSRSGVASGEVLVCDLDGGGKDISGAPVNLASKVAQDHGEFGNIYLLDDWRHEACDAEVSFRIAGSDLRVWVSHS